MAAATGEFTFTDMNGCSQYWRSSFLSMQMIEYMNVLLQRHKDIID